MKACIAILLCCSLPAWAEQPADWVVYQDGRSLQLAIDGNSLWLGKDGLVHFIHQERFARQRYEKSYRLHFYIRRTTGYADCKQYQYVFVGSEYFDQNNKHLFSTMFPVPRYAWKWQPVNEDSVAHAMMKVICEAAGAASQNN
ncbi:surface-adhesin E family protein [Chromobacterium subtsugae]|uniref:surface-adhesin E family protein n=1 Tax=Chromobacterium subtsugae TaxID=251747 RepID=UPI000640F13D|nr:surface-adhesin E family protein [Chromobacterium subtsugae]